jgi:hypothetical protein
VEGRVRGGYGEGKSLNMDERMTECAQSTTKLERVPAKGTYDRCPTKVCG